MSPRVCWVIGHPVEHSLSPVIHNAAFAACGLDWTYFAVSVPGGRAGAAVSAMRSLRLGGMSVTMPHKEAVTDLVDDVTPAARRLGAVNCVSWRGATLVGDSTDGPGFVDALRVDHAFDPDGRRCLVVGAGGAARAVVAALADAGAAEVIVANRTTERGERAAFLAADRGRTGRAEEAERCDLVVNATPLGMAGDRRSPVPESAIGPGQVVADLVYDPLETPLLAAARARGAVVVSGLGMLVHQAAHAFRSWTGEDPPVEVMSAAAVAAVAAAPDHH